MCFIQKILFQEMLLCPSVNDLERQKTVCRTRHTERVRETSVGDARPWIGGSGNGELPEHPTTSVHAVAGPIKRHPIRR